MMHSTSKKVDWPAISDQLASEQQSSTKFSRVLRAPLRSGIVFGMRKFGGSRPVAAPLPWGDTFHGFIPEAVSSVIWRTGHYEPLTTRLVIETLRPGDAFVDIGSHFGYFTLLASRLVGPQGKVFAIEAMPSTFEALKQNVTLNGLNNVLLHNFAAYSKEATLQFRDFGVVHSSLNTAFSVRGVLEGAKASSHEIKVEAKPADQLLRTCKDCRIAMIKIDAESSEEFVLEGLQETLSEHRPILLLELGGSAADHDRESTITQLLRTAGYEGRRWHNDRLEPIMQGGILPYDNYIFIHASELADPSRTGPLLGNR